MNKHILLVMKWLADKDSVSQEELKVNAAAYRAAPYAATYAAYDAAYRAATYAYDAAADYAEAAAAADYAYAAATAATAYWVERYEELSK